MFAVCLCLGQQARSQHADGGMRLFDVQRAVRNGPRDGNLLRSITDAHRTVLFLHPVHLLRTSGHLLQREENLRDNLDCVVLRCRDLRCPMHLLRLQDMLVLRRTLL